MEDTGDDGRQLEPFRRASMKVLVADDDVQTVTFVRNGLREAGYVVETVEDGRDALTWCLYNPCDVVVLDWMMPGMDGLSVLRALRAAGRRMPVILLTARASVEDRVLGLRTGADDYLVKPFHFSELEARIMALARRPAETAEKTVLVVQDLELDLLGRAARRGGQHIPLHGKEFALLEALMRRPGRVMTRTMLLEQVWDFSFDPQTTVLETHMSRLRGKVDKPFDVPLIETVRGSGYVIRAPS